MVTKKITLTDLQRAFDNGIDAMLYCDTCGAEYSAHPSDYFWVTSDEPFKCAHGAYGKDGRNHVRGTYMRLVVKRTILKDIG